MDQNNFGEVISSLFKGMDAMLASKTVVGQPTKVGDTVLVPLVDVTLGVGAGASSADKKNSGTGGFGAKMTPNAKWANETGSCQESGRAYQGVGFDSGYGRSFCTRSTGDDE